MAIIHNFVVFEGGDGSGTSTQLELLRRRFSGGPVLHTTFEPGDGPLGRLIREALRGETPLEKETLARLFAADRNEHLHGKGGILERCRRGELVVCDRYVLSSLVYQGIDCGEELPELLNRDFPAPELLFFFDLDPALALKRLSNRAVRDNYEQMDFQRKVWERYRALLPRCAAGGTRVERVDASLDPEAVAGAVWRGIKKLPIMEG